MSVRLGTRGSELALVQARETAARIEERGQGPVELVTFRTSGDRNRSAPFSRLPDQGLFTRELEEALSAGAIDLAVHSLKDLASRLPSGLTCLYTACRRREDAWLSPRWSSLAAAPDTARIGTSSARRTACVRREKPRAEIVPLRGNVGTRIRKMREHHLDGIILGAAGLVRLDREDEVREYLPVDRFTPASGQGVLGVECREDRRAEFAYLEDEPAAANVSLERYIMARLNVGCGKPVGIYAACGDTGRRLHVFIGGERYFQAVYPVPDGGDHLPERIRRDYRQQTGRELVL